MQHMLSNVVDSIASMLGSSEDSHTNRYASIEERTSLKGYYALRKTKYGSKLVTADRSRKVDKSKYYLEPIVGMRYPEKRRGRRAIKLLTQGEINGY